MCLRKTLQALTICSLISLNSFAYAEGVARGHFYNEEFGRFTNMATGSVRSQILNREIPYSIYLPPGYFKEPHRAYPVVYYIHGFDTPGIGHKDWLQWRVDETLDSLIASGEVCEMIVVLPKCFTTALMVNWGHHEMAAPLLSFPFRFIRGVFRSIDPTYFASYVFIHKNDLTRSHYSDFFISEFIRHVEASYRVRGETKYRALCGFSTGGFSSLSLAFRNPDIFDSVSAHAPMLFTVSPFSPEAREYFVEYDPRRKAYMGHTFTIHLLRRIFVDDATWQANDPIALAKWRGLDRTSVYIDVAENDRRRYDRGARELEKILNDRNVPVEFHLLEGLPNMSSHSYPGFLNGRRVAAYAEKLSDEELDEMFRWENVLNLINPNVQRIEYSLRFHSDRFSE